MRKFVSFSLNGRATGVSTFVKDKTAHALASALWSVTENNRNNSWNVNFNNGNTNNNNKSSTIVVRAVSALGEKDLEDWIEASDDCCKNKKTGRHCTEYRIREECLVYLAASVANRTYQPQQSECFVVKRPKLREIFAAHFLDRIVQHWIILRIEPLLENLFIDCGDVSFNCRKGYGTLRGVRYLQDCIMNVNKSYKGAYIGKFDIKSFFMSINKDLLWGMLRRFIEASYHEEDKETLLWLSEVTIKHKPQLNCIKKGDLSLWERLPKHKSLFYTNGMAIGNITSQILANFLLSGFDKWANNWCKDNGGCYARFVDDMAVVLPNKGLVLRFCKESNQKLFDFTKLHFHPDKVYIQHMSKGVKFIGTVIRPWGLYLSNRTVGGMWNMLNKMEACCKRLRNKKTLSQDEAQELSYFICSCNSYLGFMIHNLTYGLRRKMFGRLKHFWSINYISGKYAKVAMRNKYKQTV